MTLNRSKTFLAFSASVFLMASSVTYSDARPQAKRLSPTQDESFYYHSDYDTMRDRDSSCFSRSTGIPDQYACNSHGG